MANGQRGFRVLTDPQEEQDFIRTFVTDPGPITMAEEQFQQRTAPPEPVVTPQRQVPAEIPAPRITARQEMARQASEDAREGAARQVLGLRAIEPDIGPPSATRFELRPDPRIGLRGGIEFETPQPEFEERVLGSVRAGAFNPVSEARQEDARRIQQGRVRALRGLRELAAARRGVPAQFLDAVRQGNISAREATLLGAQQGPPAQAGVTPAQVLQAQQRQQQIGLRQQRLNQQNRQFLFEGMTDENRAVRNQSRRLAASQWVENPNDPAARQNMAMAATTLLEDEGAPGFFAALWADILGGHPQALWDPDSKISVQDILARRGFTVEQYRGEPVLFHNGNPVQEWDRIQSADKNVADFILEYVRPARVGLR